MTTTPIPIHFQSNVIFSSLVSRRGQPPWSAAMVSRSGQRGDAPTDPTVASKAAAGFETHVSLTQLARGQKVVDKAFAYPRADGRSIPRGSTVGNLALERVAPVETSAANEQEARGC
jgi:hypothetical protein